MMECMYLLGLAISIFYFIFLFFYLFIYLFKKRPDHILSIRPGPLHTCSNMKTKNVFNRMGITKVVNNMKKYK